MKKGVINYNPSIESIAKMKKVHDMKAEGKTYEKIAEELGFSKTYVIALKQEYDKMKGESGLAS